MNLARLSSLYSDRPKTGAAPAPLLPLSTLRSDQGEGSGGTLPGGRKPYFDHTVLELFARRFPWLVGLMLVQSISGWVVERFEKLIERHVILAAFLTMLVGGGGNSSGQTVATLVRALGAGEIESGWRPLGRVFAREIAIGALLAGALAVCAFPRVRLLSAHATDIDALTISISYALIVLMANAIGVVVVLTLHQLDMAAVGSPPVVQVLVDVLGIITTMLVATAILGDGEEAAVVDAAPDGAALALHSSGAALLNATGGPT